MVLWTPLASVLLAISLSNSVFSLSPPHLSLVHLSPLSISLSPSISVSLGLCPSVSVPPSALPRPPCPRSLDQRWQLHPRACPLAAVPRAP